MADVLTAFDVSRIQRIAVARWRADRAARVDDVARDVALTLYRVHAGMTPERLPSRDQTRFFAILSVVAAARTRWLRSVDRPALGALDRLRDFDAR